jgi:hypothetical protein
VSNINHISYSHPLDVLQRFMPSPVKILVEFETELILVETNDSSFLSPLAASESQASLAASPAFQWKLLRDSDVRGRVAETTLLMAGSLLVASMGPACLAGVDLERKELLAFIGGDVDAREYRSLVFPVFSGLTQFAMGKNPTIVIPYASEVSIGSERNARELS